MILNSAVIFVYRCVARVARTLFSPQSARGERTDNNICIIGALDTVIMRYRFLIQHRATRRVTSDLNRAGPRLALALASREARDDKSSRRSGRRTRGRFINRPRKNQEATLGSFAKHHGLSPQRVRVLLADHLPLPSARGISRFGSVLRVYPRRE